MSPIPAPETPQPTTPDDGAAGDRGRRYPVDVVKGEVSRQAFSPQDLIRLRFEGFRPLDEPEPVRGGFLPQPAGAAAPVASGPGQPAAPAEPPEPPEQGQAAAKPKPPRARPGS